MTDNNPDAEAPKDLRPYVAALLVIAFMHAWQIGTLQNKADRAKAFEADARYHHHQEHRQADAVAQAYQAGKDSTR